MGATSGGSYPAVQQRNETKPYGMTDFVSCYIFNIESTSLMATNNIVKNLPIITTIENNINR